MDSPESLVAGWRILPGFDHFASRFFSLSLSLSFSRARAEEIKPTENDVSLG